MSTTLQAASPAQLAKGALRRLALAHAEPTPENYARAYAEEAAHAGADAGAVSMLPAEARPLLQQMASRSFCDAVQRQLFVAEVMKGGWAAAERLLARGLADARSRDQAWVAAIAELVRGLERGGREWTLARKKDSIQRVLAGSAGDLTRLQQRLQGLLQAWESDSPDVPAEPAQADAEVASAAPASPQPEPAAPPAAADPAAAGGGAADAEAWQPAIAPWQATLAAALPEGHPRAAALADELARLAARLPQEGPRPELVQAIEAACRRARVMLGHRQELFDEVSSLCLQLAGGLAELSENESWVQGQCEALQAQLAGGLTARSVRAATDVLAKTRSRQGELRRERQAANGALKSVIRQLLIELDALGAETGRFEQRVGDHVQAIERADTLEGLTGVVQALLADSRNVQTVLVDRQARLRHEQAQAEQLQLRVSELEGELRRLSEEVSTDALTRVANRRGLAVAFETEAARAGRAAPGDAAAALSVGLIDIDNFKRLNDTLGHAAGDEALKSLAQAVQGRLRPVDTVARFGGEEFVVLLPGTPPAEAQQVLTRLQRNLSASLFMHDGHEVFVTFSAGVSLWRAGESLDEVLERADEALYEAKRSGKNRTCVA